MNEFRGDNKIEICRVFHKFSGKSDNNLESQETYDHIRE
jgi:hypothetical protein